MKPRYQYALALLILIAVYEMYLIVWYKYRDFQINAYIGVLNVENSKIESNIDRKKRYLAYVKTNAYLDRMAKSSQNRKNPGEDAIFLVDENVVKNYAKIDVERSIVGENRKSSPTLGMSNREKWFYYVLKIDSRE
ncbi:MAG: hypothetical protein QG650_202 [Patescibacteria group bacterium]|nr:hypothetical protein [Patescibacteria group bacterium]